MYICTGGMGYNMYVYTGGIGIKDTKIWLECSEIFYK